MKKLLLAAVLTVAAFAVVDADARYWRRGCNTGCNTSCEVSCEKPCEPKCAVECNPCRPKCCKKYKVIDETPCEAPLCVKYVPTTAPAICHRVCRWECPTGYVEQGTDESTVSGNYELHNQQNEVSKINKAGSSSY